GPYNSFGNGSAMRVSPVAWACDSIRDVMKYARTTANITHNHPEGIKGAQCIAVSTMMLRQGAGKAYLKKYLKSRFDYD
ncbi:ADP-ribosylglycohydrolase family protein, partial [bacterium]|nr:ADP-ribosylglycohydrolase family protein [bacterium]